MFAAKVDGRPLGEVIDAVYQTVLRSTFSKTQEEEADRYAFDTLESMGYDPTQMSIAFENLQKSYVNPSQDHAINPFRDYFASHPPIELRIENYRELASRWHQHNPKKLGYVGVRNFRERKPRSKKFYYEEEAVQD
jgi:predicted Zn-dependent protease